MSPSLLPLLLLLLLPLTQTLDLASHCSSLTRPGECPCSMRHLASPSFCLSPSSATTCHQRPCRFRYVCDCAGTTLCRARFAAPPLACTGPLAVDGQCKCARTTLRVSVGAQPTILVPLRPFRQLRKVADVFSKGSNLCSERPAFWATREGRQVLDTHWNRVVRPQHGVPLGRGGFPPLFRFGHRGHEVSFSSAAQMSEALSSETEARGELRGDVTDGSWRKLDGRVSECATAVVNVRLAWHGVGTRRESAPPAFDVAGRMVLQACPHLPASNAAVGMSVGRVLQSAMLATGEERTEDAGLGYLEAMQACRAINRNFEGCQVDVGCVAVVI